MSFYTLGKTYKELTVGDFAVQSKTISESDVYSFAGITGDLNPLHVDIDSNNIDNKRVVHAGLAPSLIAPVIGMKLPGIGSIVLNMKFTLHHPIHIGDTVFAHAQVTEKHNQSRQVVMRLTWVNQHNEQVCSGTAVVLPPKAALKRRIAAHSFENVN
jgi:3-hydroxybutyryl-CoA dehydratase